LGRWPWVSCCTRSAGTGLPPPVESYRIELEGERAEEHPRRYTRIRVRHLVSGESITSESLEQAVSLSHKKYCSVAAPLYSEIEYEVVLD
jgi:putative redox protein